MNSTATDNHIPRISVIVPVYKVEDYLAFCADSILAQTFDDFELILVDDGSPDNCGAICDSYAEKDSRVKVIHRENGGLSAARNSGMAIACGEYITFIDSDDAVTPVYLEMLLRALESNNADVSCCVYSEFEDESRIKAEEREFACELLSGRDACLSIYRGLGKIAINAWGKLYKSELIKSHYFPEGKLHEDQFTVPIVLYEAETVAASDMRYYYYRVRPESIMHDVFNVKRFDNIEGVDRCTAYYKEKNDAEAVEAAGIMRKKLLAQLNILAARDGVTEKVPPQYRLSTARALRDCRRLASDEKYSWYLAQLYPERVRLHEYKRKIKRMLGL